jgi:hypothetical protein
MTGDTPRARGPSGEQLQALLVAFRRGATRDEAAEAADVPRRTLFVWLAQGERETAGPLCQLAREAALSAAELTRTRASAGRARRR